MPLAELRRRGPVCEALRKLTEWKSRRQGVRAMDEGQRLIGWRRWIFRLTRPYVLMPAREAFIIDRAKSSCGVGVVQMLNSHWPGTSPAEHVRECYPPKIISQFHPPPLLALRVA